MSTNLNTGLHLVIVLILYSFPSLYLQQSCDSHDQASLLAFSAPLSTSSSFPPLNWSSSISCCSWEGVDCDANGRVIGLRLGSRCLEGEISSSIKNLASLTQLDLSKNSFSGFLPAGLFESLSSLEIFDLSFNQLDGNFSSSLSSNGSLPTTIRIVNISNNYFQDLIEPTMFLGASNLSSFDCSNNCLSGFIPSSICTHAPLLKALDFSYNSFIGVIPSDIGECSKLEVLWAHYNSLSDPIPWEIGNLIELRELDLGNNYLSGSILPYLMNCTNLVNLILRNNKLEGDISLLNFSRLVRLEKLDLSRNMFSGSLPESVYSCKAIVALRVAANNLTGQISSKIVELDSLSFLSFSRNSFTNITSALKILAGCKNLTTLLLGQNFHSESLPSNRSFLGSNGFPSLLYLSLIDCNFGGYFPEWISNMKNLRILHLSGNRITGEIPKWLGSLPNLFVLELANNLLSGKIPQELCLLPALVSGNLSNINNLHFDLPFFRILPGRRAWDQYIVFHSQINLENNRISGYIPSGIGRLQNLHLLYLNGNNLSGGIPVQISHLKNLEQLSLAQNHLTGIIPASLGSLNFLSKFNVSFNDLQGPIPTGRQFDTFPASSYEGNPSLCGEVVQCPCNFGQNDLPGKDDEVIGRIWFLNGFVVGIASGFSGILAFAAFHFWCKNLFRHKKQSYRMHQNGATKSFEELEVTSVHVFTQ